MEGVIGELNKLPVIGFSNGRFINQVKFSAPGTGHEKFPHVAVFPTVPHTIERRYHMPDTLIVRYPAEHRVEGFVGLGFGHRSTP